MNPKELRIGNWFFIATCVGYYGAGCVQVQTIGREGVNSWQDMGASGCIPFEKMAGIALTPELLEKSGFDFSPPNTYHLNRFVLCKAQGDSTEWYFQWNKLDHLPGQPTTHIRYLHELQNLTSALGFELTINL